MKFKMQIVIESDDGNQVLTSNVSEWERNTATVENMGLSLTESKELLRKTQQVMVQEQVREFLKQSEICPHCQRKRLSKGRHRIVYRTLFGKNFVLQDEVRNSS
jgi:DNA-directed RNA polymerase subunit RPC12/RpoP